MKKVGILTMHRIKNYGSFLQAYALKKILKQFNCNVEFVDYNIERTLIKTKSKFSKILQILKCRCSLYKIIKYILFKKNFNKYLKFLNVDNKYNYTPNLDVLIIGSDEVFNCVQNNPNVGYSLELFGKNNRAKKVITYAASFGNTTLEKLKKYNLIKDIKPLINKINFISLRDSNSINIVKNLTKKSIEYNLDPVLIYNFEKDKNFINIESKEKYIILYAYLGRLTNQEITYIKKYCKKKKLKIYAIGAIQPFADKFIDCSPFEILSYFKNSEFIITDTFHGSIFSIVTHKKFVTLVRKSGEKSYGNEEKISDLLKKLNLLDKMTYNYKDIDLILDSKFNYKKVDEIIKQEKNKSINYLKKCIK